MILHAFLFETKETFADVVREKSRWLKATPEQIFDALRNIADPEMTWLAKTHFKEAEQLGKLCERYLAKLRNLLKPYKRRLDLLMSIPGVNENAAILIQNSVEELSEGSGCRLSRTLQSHGFCSLVIFFYKKKPGGPIPPGFDHAARLR